jgi:hypothetical protein
LILPKLSRRYKKAVKGRRQPALLTPGPFRSPYRQSCPVEYAKSNSDHFLPQKRVFATKQGGHLRRTFKLDPVAEMFLYDLVSQSSLFPSPNQHAARVVRLQF